MEAFRIRKVTFGLLIVPTVSVALLAALIFFLSLALEWCLSKMMKVIQWACDIVVIPEPLEKRGLGLKDGYSGFEIMLMVVTALISFLLIYDMMGE